MEINKFLQYLSHGSVQARDGMSQVPIAVRMLEKTEVIPKQAAAVEVYVLDDDLQPVDPGQIGSLYVASAITRHNPVGSEHMVSNPFGQGYIYRTHYWGRYLQTSVVCYYQKHSDVKFGGYRIPITELVRVIQTFPEIQTCFIYPFDHEDEHALIAYLTTDDWIDLKKLKQFLKYRLPKCWLPTDYLVRDRLPTQTNGQPDYMALPLPKRFQPLIQQPQNEVELWLAELISHHCGGDIPSVNTHFFDLGMTSLQLVHSLMSLNQTFQINLPIEVMFTYSTIEQLSDCIEWARQAKTKPIVPLPQNALKLSPRQTQYWVKEQLFAGHGLICTQIMRVFGHLDLESLTLSLSALFSRHRLLRLNVLNYKGCPQPVISAHQTASIFSWPTDEFALSDHNTTDALWEQVNEAINQALYLEQNKQFDVNIDPLFRVSVVMLGEEDYLLMTSAHKLIADTDSLDILTHELMDFHASFSDDSSVMTLSSSVDYFDYAYASLETDQQQAASAQFWVNYLADVPPLELLTDYPRPDTHSLDCAQFYFEVDLELTQVLLDLAAKTHSTLSIVMLAAFQILLYRHSQQQRFAVGISDSGRDYLDTEEMIGAFESEYCICTDFQGTESIDDVIQAVKQAMFTNKQHLPFQHDLPRSKTVFARHPFYQVGFSMISQTAMGFYSTTLDIETLSAEYANSPLDLSLHLTEGSTLLGAFIYNTTLFDEATIERWVQHFSQVALEMTLDSTQRISALPMMDAVELKSIKQMLLETDHPRMILDPSTQLLDHRFALFANKAAIVGETGILTYAQLYEQANAIAADLSQQNIPAEAVIGVRVAQTQARIVALLGIQLAGLCYAIIEPDWSEAQLAHVMSSIALPVLLSDTLTPHHPNTRLIQHIPHTDQPMPTPIKSDTAHAAALITFEDKQLKIAKITYQQVSNQVSWLQRHFELKAFDNVFFQPHNPEMACWGMLWPLSIGATLMLDPPVSMLHPHLRRPTVVLLKDLESSQQLSQWFDPSYIRTVLLDQADITTPLRKHVRQQFATAKFFSLFSVFEFGGPVGYYDLTGNSRHAAHKLGHPGDNIRYHIYDEMNCSVPIGIEGTLFVSGLPLNADVSSNRLLIKEVKGTRISYVNTHIRARLLSNGEVERLTIPRLSIQPTQTDTLSSVLDEQVLQIVQALLPQATLHLSNDFFHLGGNSLLACQLAYRLSTEFGIKLSIRHVIESQSLQELVAMIDQKYQQLEQNVGVCHTLPNRMLDSITPQPLAKKPR